tara:strand:+ start:982 stop:2661 length:1680 start_codon:yes stop_codon:yes gene_type:complete
MNNHFKIIIPFYNVEKWIKFCIRSVKAQNYKNFQCILIDDLSTDNTVEIIDEEIKNDSRFKLVRNTDKSFALKNIYDAIIISQPNPEDIIVTLDGDDWLMNKQVLQKLNDCYNKHQCWMTYGSYVEYPSKRVGKFAKQIPDFVIENQSYRNYEWCSSHLRTFKLHLWDRIEKTDLLDHEGKFYKMTWDLAFMFPMIEMSGRKAKYIKELMYVYNVDNPLNDHKVDNSYQLSLEKQIRAKNKYSLIKRDKHDFTDTTFIIPLYIDSEDRLFNVSTVLRYINSIFETNIIILEATNDSSKIKSLVEMYDNVEHIVLKMTPREPMHRSKYLNLMIERVKTPYVINQDADVLVPLVSYLQAIQKVKNEDYDMVYPYKYGKFQSRIYVGNSLQGMASSQQEKNHYLNSKLPFMNFFEQNEYDVNLIQEVSEKLPSAPDLPLNPQPDPKIIYSANWNAGYGHCQVLKTNSYKNAFGENENIISYGPDDFERYKRFKTLEYKVCHLDKDFNRVYHLEHSRNKDSNNKNEFFHHNEAEYDKICKMSKQQIKEYFLSQDYVFKRGFYK